jgi:hypothetical protein
MSCRQVSLHNYITVNRSNGKLNIGITKQAHFFKINLKIAQKLFAFIPVADVFVVHGEEKRDEKTLLKFSTSLLKLTVNREFLLM